MKLPFFILLCFFVCKGYAQVSKAIDSTIVTRISSLDTSVSKLFLAQYEVLVNVGLYKRMDSLSYKYAFSTCSGYDSLSDVTEWYFNSKDSAALLVYVNGEEINYAYENSESFSSLQKKYAEGKTIRKADYEKTQVYHHGRIQPTRRRARSILKMRLKHKNTIATYVDRETKTSKVSFLLAPKHPFLFVTKRNGGKF